MAPHSYINPKFIIYKLFSYGTPKSSTKQQQKQGKTHQLSPTSGPVEKWRHLMVAGAFFSVTTKWPLPLFNATAASEGGTHVDAPVKD